MDKQTKKDIEDVIEALTFCEKEGKKCKKCKKKDECILFVRSAVAVCLKLLLKKKTIKESMHI